MDWDPSEAMPKYTSTAIKRLSHVLSLGSERLLTGFCAMLAPEIDPYKKQSREFCEVLEINRRSKYVKARLENRVMFDNFFDLDGDINIGERVISRGGDDGKLIEKESDGSVTIQLFPWGTKVKFKSASAARMRHRAPILDVYGREEQSDMLPRHIKETIDPFFPLPCSYFTKQKGYYEETSQIVSSSAAEKAGHASLSNI